MPVRFRPRPQATMTAPMHAPAPLLPSVSEPLLLREAAGGIAVLTLNRPERRNIQSEAMLAALSEAFSAIARDSSVRAVVLAANGLSMSEIKSEHIDGVTRRELESEECARWPEQPVGLAHPCSGKGVFSRRCNRPYKK
jgi:Enoyl-CoA hydratase/isomerase